MTDRKVRLDFTPEEYARLDALARQRGTTMEAILRDAVALEKWVVEEIEKGRRRRER
jgi:predicted transcriptional regulator